MRLTYHAEEYNTVFVLGGFLPGPLATATSSIVTEIQVVDRDGQPRKRSEAPDSPHWSELWEGPPFVVYGHTPARQVKRTEWSLCIDTGLPLRWPSDSVRPSAEAALQVRARRVLLPEVFELNRGTPRTDDSRP
jgi:hypothetical protein